MIHFKCDHCGKSMRIGPEHAGKTVRCPQCREPVIIPSPHLTNAQTPSRPQATTYRRPPRRAPERPDHKHPVLHLADLALNALARAFGEDRRRSAAGFCLAFGLWIGLLQVLLLFGVSIHRAFENDSLRVFLNNLGLLVFLVALLLAAAKCGNAAIMRSDCQHHRKCFSNFTRAIALVYLGLGISVIIGAAPVAYDLRSSGWLLWALTAGMGLGFFGLVLNAINGEPTTNEPALRPADHAIELGRQSVTALLWTAPIVFGFGLALAMAIALYHVIRFLTSDGMEAAMYRMSSDADVSFTILVAATPLGLALIALAQSLLIEVAASLLKSGEAPVRAPTIDEVADERASPD